MEQLKKMVPVVAVGLAVAAMSSVDACAAEEPPQPVDTDSPAKEVTQENTAPSTEINTAVAVQTPEGSEPPAASETPDTPSTSDPVTTPEETPGPTQTELVVNPGTDAENNVTSDGNLTITTTPGETTEVTEPTGDPTTTVTTNPDGSTTTTTTTPNQTTTTENSSSTITGNITDEGKPSEGEMENVKTGWENFVKDHGATEEEVTNEDGSKSTVYTIVETSDPEASHLTAAELSTVLGVTLTQVGDDTYTYTTQNGETVTVTTVAVTDNSTETTTTKWTITVTEKSEEKHIEFLPSVTTKVDVDKDAKEILDRISNNDDGITIVAWDKTTGYVKKATEGTKTYEFSYKVTPKEVDLANMSAAEIFQFLPQNEGYRLEAGKILDRNGNELVLNPNQSLLVQKLLIVSMTVTDSHGGGVSTHVYGKPEAEATATKDAATEAVLSAILRDVAGVSKETAELSLKSAEATYNGSGSWTVKVEIGEATYTYRVHTENAGDDKYADWTVEQIKQQLKTDEDIASGFISFVSNTAYVYGSTVVWSDTLEGKFSLTDEGKINVKVDDEFPGLAKVDSVTQNDDGSTTVVAKNATGVTYTYTFTYGKPTEDELAALRIQLGQNQEYDFDQLTKTTWTVTVTSDRDVSSQHLTTSVTSNDFIGVDKVEKGDGGYYCYLDNNEVIYFQDGENGKYSFTNIEDSKTYILTVENASPAPVEGDALKALQDRIESCGILPEGYTFYEIQGNTAIYKKGNDTIVVTFDNVADKVSLEVLEDKFFSESTEAELKEAIIKWIMERDSVSEEAANKTYEELVRVINVDKDSTSEIITQYIRTAQGMVDYTAKGDQAQLLALLKEYQSFGPGTRNYTNPHIDVSVKVNLIPVGSSGGLEPDASKGGGYLLPGLNVSLYETAEDLIFNKPLAHSTGYTENLWNYKLTLDDGDKLSNANFYKITGTVAYDFLTEPDGIDKILSFNSEDEAKKYIDEHQLDYVAIHYPDYSSGWYLCKTAELTACDYMYDDSCADGGYTIDLGKLALLKEKFDYIVPTYSTTITNKAQLGGATISTLTLKNFHQTVIGDTDSDISGSYQVTDTKTADSLIGENGSWLHTGIGSDWYITYQTWVPTSTEAQDVATHEQYSGNLNYSYTEKSKDVQVDASVEKDRDVQVKLDQTSVTTVTGETSTSTTTPAPSNPGGSSGSGSSGSSSRPSSRPSNPSTPENPSVNIPEEDVPLTNLPNEDVPLTDRPDETPTEQPPVTLLPEEDVPLAETPVQARAVSAANTTRISDAQTPLADVPETGDPMLMEAFAAAAAGANALWFSMGKKRRDDAE